MPFINAKLSLKLNESQKEKLQEVLTNAVVSSFGKPKSFVMASIEDNKDLYMGGTKLENGAYIAISLLGSTTKPVCNQLTNMICETLCSEFGTDGKNIYISYHSVDLWGWNGQMF